MSTSLTTLRAAAMWSCLIWSTVALNSWVPSSPALPRMLENEPERLAMLPLLRNGVDAPDRPPVTELERVKIWVVRGLILSELATPGVIAGLDVLPTAVEGSGARGRSASIAARSSRFVVPVALDSPERAEQTSATRFPESMKELDLESAVSSTEPYSGPVHPLRYLPPPLLPQPLPSLCIHSDESRDQMASRRSEAPRLHPRHRRALLLRSQHSRDDLLRYRFHELADARPAVLLDLCRACQRALEARGGRTIQGPSTGFWRSCLGKGRTPGGDGVDDAADDMVGQTGRAESDGSTRARARRKSHLAILLAVLSRQYRGDSGTEV